MRTIIILAILLFAVPVSGELVTVYDNMGRAHYMTVTRYPNGSMTVLDHDNGHYITGDRSFGKDTYSNYGTGQRYTIDSQPGPISIPMPGMLK